MCTGTSSFRWSALSLRELWYGSDDGLFRRCEVLAKQRIVTKEAATNRVVYNPWGSRWKNVLVAPPPWRRLASWQWTWLKPGNQTKNTADLDFFQPKLGDPPGEGGGGREPGWELLAGECWPGPPRGQA